MKEARGLTAQLKGSFAIHLKVTQRRNGGGCPRLRDGNCRKTSRSAGFADPVRHPAHNMNSQEAWKRLANQLQKAATSGGRGGVPGGKGAFAGGGLLIALVAGGFVLNASLFNGACVCHSAPKVSH